MTQDTLRGRFNWHELLTSDPAAAAAFYVKVVGWQTQAWPQGGDYTLFVARTQPVAGLMTLPDEAKQMGAPPHWLSYIGTSDVDATASRVTSLGGQVLKAPWDIPTVGRIAIVCDPQGAVFGLYAPEQAPPVGGAPTVGEFSWHELMTTDQAAALAFYRDLFGWDKTSSMDMGPEMGTYDMFGLDGVPMGGIMKRPPNVPSNWLPYAMIPDSKRAAKTIVSLGATIMQGPMEVPGGDWIVVGKDLQGAVFAVHSAKPSVAAKPAKKKTSRKKASKKAAPKKAVAKTATKATKKSAKKSTAKPAARSSRTKKAAAKRVVKKAGGPAKKARATKRRAAGGKRRSRR